MNILRKPFKYTYKNACMVLVLIQCAIFVFTRLVPIFNPNFVLTYFALIPPYTIHANMFWQVFTYQFLHADTWHLLFNMLSLYFFGTALEQKIGTKEFLLFYFLCGTLCGIVGCGIYYLLFLKTFVPTILLGASGTIFSILLAFATLFPDSRIYFWGLIPIPAPVLILIYTVIEVYGALASKDNTAHSIHLLGLLWAFLYILIRFGINPITIWRRLFKP